MSRRAPTAAALAALALAVPACGDDGNGKDSSGPVAGESVELEVAEGEVLVRQPNEDTFASLEAATLVPVGTLVDASEGIVRITSATRDSGMQTGEFSKSGFELSQEQGSSEVTLTLRGGDYSRCRTEEAMLDRSTVGGPKIRELFVDADGDYRTEGMYAAATIRGTRFAFVDACFGTLTAVEEGQVTVSDLTAEEEIELGSGENYWAAIGAS